METLQHQSQHRHRFADVSRTDAQLLKRVEKDVSWSLILIDLMCITEAPESLEQSLKMMRGLIQKWNPTGNPDIMIEKFVEECRDFVADQKRVGLLPDSISDVDAMHLCSLTSEDFPAYKWASAPFRDFSARLPKGYTGVVLTSDNKCEFVSEDVIAAATYYKGLLAAQDRLPLNFTCKGTVFRGLNHQFSLEDLKVNFRVGRQVRFFEPRSSSTDFRVATTFGRGSGLHGMTVLEIQATHGILLQNFSFIDTENEVLFPMFSLFEVVSVNTKDPRCHYIRMRQSPNHPISFQCPLSRELKLMHEPVTAMDGRAYEKANLVREMKNGWNTTPPTVLANLKVNKPLQNAIQHYRKGDEGAMTREFQCGLHHGIMSEPVTDFNNGETHEESWLQKWLGEPREGFAKSPLKMSDSPVYEPNIPLKRAIREYKLHRPSEDFSQNDPPHPPGQSVAIGGTCRGCGHPCQVPVSLGHTDFGDEPDLLTCSHCQESFCPSTVYVWPGSECTLHVTYRIPGQRSTRCTEILGQCDAFQQREIAPVGAEFSYVTIEVK